MKNVDKSEVFKDEIKVMRESEKLFEDFKNGREISHKDYEKLLMEYKDLLNLAVQMNKVADLMTNGLNNMKNNLEERVNIDELTGLYNRRHLIISMEKYIKEAMRNNAYLSVLFIDVDCFKKYNDRYGHVQGDMCLRKVAEGLLKSTLRAFDFVARYGGEEFFVILPFVDSKGAVTVANRILENIRNLNIEHLDNTADNRVTVSVGVTSFHLDVDSEVSMGDFVKTADKAMYISKSEGRNRYTYLDITELN